MQHVGTITKVMPSAGIGLLTSRGIEFAFVLRRSMCPKPPPLQEGQIIWCELPLVGRRSQEKPVITPVIFHWRTETEKTNGITPSPKKEFKKGKGPARSNNESHVPGYQYDHGYSRADRYR